NVGESTLSTTLMKGGVRVDTVEHLLSAIFFFLMIRECRQKRTAAPAGRRR
ncbi:MAG: UDP-3-O-acyl-N-acetylglucosamine deacetylase, partial [Pseudomonadales bacterium]|nr:UDP-3-O-acyl-N-acetylglucosamine deacetylase [Pseudomonadales bacterium]